MTHLNQFLMFNHCPVLGPQPKPVLIRVTWVAHMGGGGVKYDPVTESGCKYTVWKV